VAPSLHWDYHHYDTSPDRRLADIAPVAMPTNDASRWSLLAIGQFPDEVKTDFRTAFNSAFLDTLPARDLNNVLGARDILITSFGHELRRDTISALPRSIKAIATYSVGYEHIDIDAAKERGLPVFNTPDVLTDAVAEIGLLLMLGAARRVTESINLVRGRSWAGWSPAQLIGIELLGKTLGIFGMGRIGRGIAHRARACGMAIHYSNRTRLVPELETGAVYHADFRDMAGEADVLMIAAQSSPETRHFLNAERVAYLRDGAIVCNVARGDLIDDDALIASLENGRVRAAGLDVFENEPKIDPRYYDLPNVFMLPHIGSSTIETRRRMAQSLILGLLTWKAGGKPANRLI
jgi:lactate dehydrogenase-like 2-hydroxyacid dehydrogenase